MVTHKHINVRKKNRYKWLYMGWTLEHRLTYLEEHWAYFLGFGKIKKKKDNI